MSTTSLKTRFLLTAILLFVTAWATVSRAADKPEMLFYYSNDCDECARVKAEFLPGFLQEYADVFDFTELEVSEPGVMDSLLAMESRVAVPEADKEYPAVYFMGRMFEGETQVRLQLPAYVQQFIADPDPLWVLHNEVMARVPDMTVTQTTGAEFPVAIAYFSKTGCSECARAEEIVDWLEASYPFVTVDFFDIGDERSKLIATVLGDRTGVPEGRLMSTPEMFVGDKTYLLAEHITRDNLARMVEFYGETGAGPVWRYFSDEELAQAETRLSGLFHRFTLVAVALAGLGDGINPCAFATILFFVSYLTMIGRRRNEILIVGLTFAFAVFITYFLVGLGFYNVVSRVSNLRFVSKIIFGATGALCVVFGFLSIRDYTLARTGKVTDMALQLPEFLKKRIHATIRNRVRMKSFVMGALLIGFLVSILELACTGQVYLPTITLMVGRERMAIPYLLLYNVAFILPLLAVFGIVYYGVSSRAINGVMEARIGTVKIGLAIVFFLLGGLLLWSAFLTP